MLDELTIHGVRGIDRLHLEGLSLVNVIAGDNGAGKTTILESIVLLFRATPIELRRTQAMRGIPSGQSSQTAMKDLSQALFRGFEDSGVATIEGLWSGQRWRTKLSTSRRVQFVPTPDDSLALHAVDEEVIDINVVTTVDGKPMPDLNGSVEVQARLLATTDRRPTTEDANTLGDLQLATDQRSRQQIVAALQTIRPEAQDVFYVQSSAGAGFYVRLEHGFFVPLGALGGGANALFRYLLAMQKFAGGVLAIDEVEGGFHYSRVGSVFKALLTAARLTKTQIFCTTHSKEVLTALVEAAAETPENDLSVISAYRDDNGQIAAQVLREREAFNSLKYGYELR